MCVLNSGCRVCTVSPCTCCTDSQADDAGTKASLLPTASNSQVVFLSLFQQKLYKMFLKLGGMRNMLKKRKKISTKEKNRNSKEASVKAAVAMRWQKRVHTHACIHTRMHAHTCTHTRTHTHMHMRVHARIHTTITNTTHHTYGSTLDTRQALWMIRKKATPWMVLWPLIFFFPTKCETVPSPHNCAALISALSRQRLSKGRL